MSYSAKTEVVLLAFHLVLLPLSFYCLCSSSFLCPWKRPCSLRFPPLFLISGAKTGTDISDGTCDPGLSSPASYMNPFPVLHLVEDLRLALEMLELPQERSALLSQIPGPTVAYIKEWFEGSLVSRLMA